MKKGMTVEEFLAQRPLRKVEPEPKDFSPMVRPPCGACGNELELSEDKICYSCDRKYMPEAPDKAYEKWKAKIKKTWVNKVAVANRDKLKAAKSRRTKAYAEGKCVVCFEVRKERWGLVCDKLGCIAEIKRLRRDNEY